MLREYASELKNYNLYEELRYGDYVDSKESNIWKVAQVKSISKSGVRTRIEIRYDGYSYRLDDVSFDKPTSHRLAPFRRFSLPYTGPTEPKREYSKTSLYAHSKNLLRLAQVYKQKPQWINQYLRGELFIFVDTLLCRKYIESYKYMENILSFWLAYIREGNHLLQSAQDTLVELEKEGSIDPNLVYVHPRIGCLFAITEMLYLFNLMLTRFDRLRLFYKNHDMTINKSLRDALLAINVYQVCQRILAFRNAAGRGLPWSIKKEALLVLISMNPVARMFPAITDPKEMIEVLDYMNYFIQQGLFLKEYGSQKTAELIVSLLTSGNFEGRLRGLNEAKKYLYNPYGRDVRDKLQKYMKSRQVIYVLIDNNNFNSEIFKRSIPVFSFAFAQRMLTRKHLSQILTYLIELPSLHKDKHELDLKLFYGCIADFGTFLDKATTVDFFKQITTLPIEENMIVLVKYYTLNVINRNEAYRVSYSSPYESFGISYLWDLITSEREINQYLKGKIIEAFAALLSNYYFVRDVEKYIVSAIQGIQERKDIGSYFKVIHEALKITERIGIDRINRAIDLAYRNTNIVDSVINALKETLKYTPKDKDSKQVTYKLLYNTFEFLEEVCHVSRRKITLEQIKKLWAIQACRNYLLKLLRKYRYKDPNSEHKSYQKIIYKQLDQGIIKYLIDQMFLNEQEMAGYQNVTAELYQTADELLISYNHNNNGIYYNFKHTLRTKYIDRLYGMSFYLRVINKCNDLTIVDRALKRLIEFHLRVCSDRDRFTQNDKFSLWNVLLEKLMNLERHELRAYRVMLEELNGRMKSLNILEPDPYSLVVLNRSTNKRKTITVPRYTSLWKFRHVIAEQMGLKETNFDIFLNNSPKTTFYKEEDYSVALITNTKETPPVIIMQAKDMHPHHLAVEQFQLCMEEKCGYRLYDLLDNPSLQQEANNVLKTLPLVRKVVYRIAKFKYNNKNYVFNSSSMGKLGYQLRVINEKSLKNMSFICDLLDRDFLEHISKIFLVERDQGSYRTLADLMKIFVEMTQFARKKIKATLPALFTYNYLCALLHISYDLDYSTYICRCFSLLKYVSSIVPKNIYSIFRHRLFPDALRKMLLSRTVEPISYNIFETCKQSSTLDQLINVLTPLLNFYWLQTYQYYCRQLFILLSLMATNKDCESIHNNLRTTLRAIYKSSICYKSEDEPNDLLLGLLLTMKAFISDGIQINDILDCSSEEFRSFLISPCLFNLSNPSKIKFKSMALRELSFQLLYKCQKGDNSHSQLNNILRQLMADGAWRKPEYWAITPTHQQRNKLAGLVNLAATCYINSLVQQLLFIGQFSHRLLQVDAAAVYDKENIVKYIQNIFAHLLFSYNSSVSTISLCKTFILDGAPIDPRMQTDVDEFFHTLMDKLERNLSNIGHKEIIHEVFGGEFVNLIVGQYCSHTSERIYKFLSIRLYIKGKSSLYQALQYFIKGEVLYGYNSYFCYRCDRKVKAIKRVCLKTPPDVLIVTLKRFEFDFDTMQKFKLNTYCSFPEYMNFLPYTRDGIQNDHEVDAEDYAYRLKGIIIHYGFSEAGHYTSYVRTDQTNWSYFDDEKIYDFNVSDLKNYCFGGIEENPFGDDYDKKKNAYLLFYEKVKPSYPCPPVDLLKTKVYESIYAYNMANKLVNLLFEPTIYCYLRGSSETDAKTYLLYYHTIHLRSACKMESLAYSYQQAQYILCKRKDIAAWYLAQINKAFINEFLIHTEVAIRTIVTALVIYAAKSAPVDLYWLEQMAAMIFHKGTHPMVKIFPAACRAHKDYYKWLNRNNFGDIVLSIIKSKPINCLLYSRKSTSYFGNTHCVYQEKANYDTINLLQAIESLKANISEEYFEQLMIRTKKPRNQLSLAMLYVRKYSDMDKFVDKMTNFVYLRLLEYDHTFENYYLFSFVLLVLYQFSKISDDSAPKRILKIAQTMIYAIDKSTQGYRAELLLLRSMFKMCSASVYVRNAFADIFAETEGKRISKAIKYWIRYSPNVSQHIRTGKWGYWRKPKGYSSMQSFNIDYEKIPVDKYLSQLNSIVSRHNFEVKPDTDLYIVPGQAIRIQNIVSKDSGHCEIYRVVRKFALLLDVKSDYGKIKFVTEEDAIVVDE